MTGENEEPVVEKSLTELARERIDVTTSKETGTGPTGEDEPETPVEAVEEEAVAEEEPAAEAEAAEEEAEEETVESLKAKSDKLTKSQDRMQKRIDRITAEKKAAEERATSLEKRLAEKPADERALTEEDVKEAATRLTQEQLATRAFNDACDKIAEQGEKIDKNFTKKVVALAEDSQIPLPVPMITALDELDNGGAVLNYLTDNIEEYEKLVGYSPTRMAVQLAKIGTKLAEEAKPKPKLVSKVPAPINPVGSSPRGTGTPVLNDKMDMDDWMRARTKQLQQREADRRAGRL